MSLSLQEDNYKNNSYCEFNVARHDTTCRLLEISAVSECMTKSEVIVAISVISILPWKSILLDLPF